MDRKHLVNNSDSEIGLHILSKTTNFDNEINKFLRELPSLSEYGVEHALEHTQELDDSCSSLSTIPYSESLVTYVEYEHGVKTRPGHGI